MQLDFVHPWIEIGAITLALMLPACAEEPPPSATGPAAAQVSGNPGNAGNRPAQITSVRFEPAEPMADEAVRAVVKASDPDGDPVKLIYAWEVAGRAVGRGTQRLVLDGASRGDDFQVSVVATDGRAESEPFRFRGTVANRPPRVERLTIEPATRITAGMTLVIRPEGSDDDDDDISFQYAWTLNGESIDHDGPEFDTRSLTRGDVVTVAVRAHDGTDVSEPLAAPEFQVVNQPPRVVSTPSRSLPGGGFHYRVEAEDPDGDRQLRFELEDPPAGMKIGAVSGEIEWRPTDDQTGHYTVRVIVNDLKGGRIAHSFDLNVAGHAARAGESGT
ncbi:MAG: hypothetical protein JRE13_13070 [Deltaproteobacteria bacterium]|nr:hypothetical protein [Deltaproteobacteria bacterium]